MPEMTKCVAPRAAAYSYSSHTSAAVSDECRPAGSTASSRISSGTTPGARSTAGSGRRASTENGGTSLTASIPTTSPASTATR